MTYTTENLAYSGRRIRHEDKDYHYTLAKNAYSRKMLEKYYNIYTKPKPKPKKENYSTKSDSDNTTTYLLAGIVAAFVLFAIIYFTKEHKSSGPSASKWKESDVGNSSWNQIFGENCTWLGSMSVNWDKLGCKTQRT